jgi:capsular exopolysaccharide synthesis family protein
LQLELTDAIPQRGIDFINKIIEVYAKQSAEHKNEISNSTLNIINDRLSLLTDELNSAEKDIENYKQNNALTDVGQDAARFIQLADQTDQQISGLSTQINAINSLESSLNALSNPDTFTILSSFNIENPAITMAISAFNQALQKRKSTLQASGSGNPMIAVMDKELVDIKNALVSNVRSIKSELVRSRNELSSQSSQYRARISSVPTAQRALLEINRDQGLKQNLYLFLLQKREEEALSISVPFSDTRIIERPKSTSYPVTGGKTPIYLGALLFGLFVPFIFVFAKQTLNTKIVGEQDVKKLTDCSILAKIATNKTKDVVVVSENNTTPVAEMFRLMRYNLKFLSQGKSNQVIMVTSGQPGEGKTFISINLGMSLAITGKKVVVLGFDLRAPKLTESLGVVYNYGLSDYIVSPDSKANDIITSFKDNSNLSIIGSGSVPPNPGELMLSPRVEQLLLELKAEFDYIIIDTPPIGKVADAYALGGLVDATLFVVRQNYSPKANINIVNEISEITTGTKPICITS